MLMVLIMMVMMLLQLLGDFEGKGLIDKSSIFEEE